MVLTMPASQYLRYLRSARMLSAEQSMVDIQSASFHAFTDDNRDKVMRALKSESKRWLFEPLKDFAEVAANFAKRLKDGR